MTERRTNQRDRDPAAGSNICGDYGHLNRRNLPCKNWTLPGGRSCRRHVERSKTVRQALAEGAIVRELTDWGLRPGEYVDPGEMFLQLIAQSSRRVQHYAQLVARAVELAAAAAPPEEEALKQLGLWPDAEERPTDRRVEDIFARGELAGLTAPLYASTPFGERIKIGEQVRALILLESQERDRLANLCVKAIAAGLEERRVRMAEAQGANLAAVIKAFAAQLGLTAGQMERVPDALRSAVGLVFGDSVMPKQIEGQVTG